MKKLILSCSLLSALFAGAQTACSVTATPTSSTINCGQSVQLAATSSGGAISMANDFNLGSAGAGWSTTSGAQFNNPCGASTNGTPYLWMGAGSAAPRTLTTNSLNISCAGTICFDLRFSIQGGASPCEGPDLATEGVYLQYSTNGGGTWNTIFYFDPNINGTGGSAASPYTTWANYCFAIPGAAISPTTQFRWAQLAVSAAVNDHWGIDNVVISGSCANPHYYAWVPSTGLSATNVSNPVASPTTSTTYTVYYTDGISDSCSATVAINVIQPNVDAGPTASICAGDSVVFSGSSTSTVNQQVTFNSTGSTPINDLSTAFSTINVSGLGNPTINITSISQVCINLTHTWDSDIDITLQCPGGLQLLLSGANGGAGDNYTNTCFTPVATNVIGSTGNNTAPFTGTYAPEGAGGFSNFNGCNSNGTWTLTIADMVGGDFGNLIGWSIVFNDNVTPAVSWSPNTGMTGANTLTPSFTPTVSGTYTVTLSTFAGCTVTDTVQVMVNPLPTPFAGNDAAICSGDTTNLNANGGSTFSWSPAAGLSSASVANPDAFPTATTDYTVTVSNGTCSGQDVVQVLVNPLPVVDAGTGGTVCNGTNVNLQASGANSYTWTPSTGLSATNISNPVSSASTTTTYYAVGTDGNGCSKLDSVTVIVNPVPIAAAGSDVAICAGGTGTTLNGSGGGTYSWGPGTGLNNTASATPTANPTVTTNYTLTVTNGFGCIDKDTITVTVNPQPPVDAGPNKIICSGSTVQLNGSGATSYVWSPAATLSNSSISNPVATPTANTTYTVVGTDANGCTKTDAVSVILLANPSVTASNDPTICPGSPTTLTATSSATSFTWSPSAGLTSTNTSTTTATPALTTTYTVTVTQNGCTGKDSVTVNVAPLPVVSAGPDAAICKGDSTQLNASGGISYSWSPATGLSSSTVSNPISTTTTTVAYVVTATDANGCTNKDTVSVMINNLPNVSAGSNLSLCVGDSVQLNASGAVNYQWSASPSLSDTTIANPISTATATTTYTVTGVDANGCMNTANVTVNANPLPVVTVNNSTICSGSVDTLVANGATNYTWSPAGTVLTPNSIEVSPASTTIYTVTGTDGNGCVSTATATVSVVASLSSNPVATNISCNAACNGSANANITPSGNYTYSWNNGDTTAVITNLCPGTYTFVAMNNSGCSTTDSVTISQPTVLSTSATTTDLLCFGINNGTANISASGGTAGYTYVWSSTGSGSSVNNLGAGTYTVFVSDANNCMDTIQFTITQPTALAVTATSGNLSCFNAANGSATVNASGGTSGYTYTWSSIGSGPSANNLTAGAYTVTVTDQNGCQDTVQFMITQPAVLTASLTATNITCTNTTGSISSVVAGGTAAYTYMWQPSGTGTNPGGLAAGTYTLSVTDANNCTATQTVTITSSTVPPTAGAGADAILNCGAAATLNLNGTSSAANSTFSWSGPNGFTSSLQNPVISDSGTYIVTVTNTANGCSSTDTVDIGQASIDASFTASPTSGFIPLNVSFTNASSNATAYSWTFGNGSTSTATNTSTTYNTAGVYSVILIATNSAGCIDSDTVDIVVSGAAQILVPNIFSPNGDGINDVFFITNSGLKELNVLIYDRWGIKVTEITTPGGTWTGSGSSDGTYFYMVRATGLDDKEITQQGYVQLVR
jgi:gliding motility-associated-like protein